MRLQNGVWCAETDAELHAAAAANKAATKASRQWEKGRKPSLSLAAKRAAEKFVVSGVADIIARVETRKVRFGGAK